MDFADALHLARSEGCGALVSFDQKLAQLAEQLNLQPTVQCL
jgi:predicted nucleic acid-binding protein